MLRRAIDHDMLLAWKLGFHYFTSAAEAGRLGAEHVVWKNSRPVEFFIPPRAGAPRWGWYVPIRSQDQPLLRILLPKQGPVFKSKDPYGRLVRLAASHGIQLTRRALREACLTYAMASGLFHQEVAALARIRPDRIRRHFMLQVTRANSRQFWALAPDLQWVATLPQHRRDGFCFNK